MTRKSDKTEDNHYDVIVVGGGPAGSTAAMFISRYGLETLLLDRGRSSLGRIAHLENYLGYPAGIDIETFYELMHSQVERSGCTVRDELVEHVELTADSFRVETTDGGTFNSNYVVAASKYDDGYLRGIDDESLFTTQRYQGETYETIDTDAIKHGRTQISGLYIAGRLAEDHAQVQLHAGHGAEVGLSLITDRRRERGFPDELASAYHDWIVVEGGYGDEEWESNLRDQFDDAIGDDTSLSEETVDGLREEWVDEHLAWQLTPEERDQKHIEGQQELARHLDDEVLVDIIDEEVILRRAEEIRNGK